MLKLFDTHCHINDERFQSDRAEDIARMREAGIRRAVLPTRLRSRAKTTFSTPPRAYIRTTRRCGRTRIPG